MAGYGLSLLFLFLARTDKIAFHPAAEPGRWVLALMVVSLANPGLNTFQAGAAQIFLYAAILGPIFWMSKFELDLTSFVRILAIMCTFNTLSAFTGVLQVQFPGRLQPALSTFSQTSGENLEGLYITTATGERVFRPMGLTDQPGGAGYSAFYAILINIGFFLWNRRLLVRGLCAAGVLTGFTCIYLCQVRSLFVIVLVAICLVCVMLYLRGMGSKLLALAGILGVVAVGAILWATYLGGETIISRFQSLTDESPGTVYYNNRGVFLEQTLTDLLPRYPLGAGLGRWGMTNAYLGDDSDPAREPIWVEIQVTGWLLDGGVPLILVYTICLGLTAAFAYRVSRSRSPLALWATVILPYNLALMVLTFSYPVFASQLGMEFWFLNACFFATWAGAHEPSRYRRRFPEFAAFVHGSPTCLARTPVTF
jgi:hypothetical protein